MKDVVQLHAGRACARLAPWAGGRICALRLEPAGGGIAREVLHPYPEDIFDPIRWAKGGIYPLIPYSNRIAQACLQVDGQPVLLAPHPDAAPHTLHGNAHGLPWTLHAHSADRAALELDAAVSAAWPWRYHARMELQLAPSALQVSLSLRNDDQRRFPAGLGLHPYFRHRSDARLVYRASAAWPPTADFLAVASRVPLAHEVHAQPLPLRAGGLTDYLGGWDGHARVELPEGEQVEIQADPLFSHLVVHRPDSLAYLCLEPVSHVADGFNLAAQGVAGTGTQWLAPGESLHGSMVFSLRGAGA